MKSSREGGRSLASRSGFVNDVNRREQLARLIVASPLMDKAIVNRIWGHFLGYGFTKPVDDMGPHNGISHPDLLNELAGEFRKAKFDLKKLRDSRNMGGEIEPTTR